MTMRCILLVVLSVCAVLATGGCTNCQFKEPFKKVWEKHIQMAYNWIPADKQARDYADKEDAARAYLRALREVENVYRVSDKLQADGFTWREENFDFISYAWVTIAGRRGDCDDFMALWQEIVKFRGETKRITVTSTEGRGHAMLFFYQGEVLYIFSNLTVLGVGKKGDEDKLVRLFYRDKTDCWIAY